MNFGFTPEQSELHARMRALGQEADAAPAEHRFEVLARGGALGLPLPRDVGGSGYDLVSTAYAYEGLGATLRDGGVLLAAGAHLFGVALAVAKVGTDEQRQALLPRFATGELVGTVAATELDSGSDIALVATAIDKTEAGYRISGAKRFVTWADKANLYLVIGRHGHEGRGISTLLVPRSADGIAVGTLYRTAGLEGARLGPVTFSSTLVGPEALLGREGAGLSVFQIAMTFERALILAFRLGALERALGEAVRFARTRRLGESPIAKHQAVMHRIARMKLRLETSRLLVYRAAWALDQGQRGQAEAALAKWHVGEAALASALDDLSLRGGAGFVEDSGMPTAVSDAIGGSLHSGTGDVLALIVARWLGL